MILSIYELEHGDIKLVFIDFAKYIHVVPEVGRTQKIAKDENHPSSLKSGLKHNVRVGGGG